MFVFVCCLMFFFFKQKTAYEMRISDWSSDVCSSDLLADSHAGAVVMRDEDAAGYAGTALIARDPYSAFARMSALFEPQAQRVAGIHPSAVVDPSAVIGDDAHVGAFTSIGARSHVGAGATIGPGCVIGDDCVGGAGSHLIARVTLVTRVRLGQRVRVHPGAVLGAGGLGLAVE